METPRSPLWGRGEDHEEFRNQPTNPRQSPFWGGKQFYRSEQVADSGPSPHQSTSSLLVRVRMCVPVHVCMCVCVSVSLVGCGADVSMQNRSACASLESEPSPSARALSLRLLQCHALCWRTATSGVGLHGRRPFAPTRFCACIGLGVSVLSDAEVRLEAFSIHMVGVR